MCALTGYSTALNPQTRPNIFLDIVMTKHHHCTNKSHAQSLCLCVAFWRGDVVDDVVRGGGAVGSLGGIGARLRCDATFRRNFAAIVCSITTVYRRNGLLASLCVCVLTQSKVCVCECMYNLPVYIYKHIQTRKKHANGAREV